MEEGSNRSVPMSQQVHRKPSSDIHSALSAYPSPHNQDNYDRKQPSNLSILLAKDFNKIASNIIEYIYPRASDDGLYAHTPAASKHPEGKDHVVRYMLSATLLRHIQPGKAVNSHALQSLSSSSSSREDIVREIASSQVRSILYWGSSSAKRYLLNRGEFGEGYAAHSQSQSQSQSSRVYADKPINGSEAIIYGGGEAITEEAHERTVNSTALESTKTIAIAAVTATATATASAVTAPDRRRNAVGNMAMLGNVLQPGMCRRLSRNYLFFSPIK
jgi:hypothetical protein